LWQNFGGTVPYASAREMMVKSFDHGITHFDLANNYGPPPAPDLLQEIPAARRPSFEELGV